MPDGMRPLDRRQLTLLRVRAGLLGAALLALGVLIDSSFFWLSPAPAGTATGAALVLALAAVLILPGRRYRSWGWRLDEDELRIASGRIVRSDRIVPLGRVQHIDVVRGPLQRSLGLASLVLHTAGTRSRRRAAPGPRSRRGRADPRSCPRPHPRGPGVSDAVADRRLHPATLLGRMLRALPQSAGGIAAFLAIAAKQGTVAALLVIAAGIALAAAAAFLGWWRFRYGVGAREIVIESGVLRRQRRVIPFERVQDIAIERRLLARLFGTAHVRIETGGAAADEGHLDSISLADAHRLRDIIRGRHEQADAFAETAAQPEEPLLFAMPLGRVLYSGLFNFSLVFVAAIFAVLQNVEELGFWKPRNLPPEMAETVGHAWVAASLFAAAALLLLGTGAGIIRTLARDFGFRLTRAPNGLRRRRGLATLSEAVIPARRIQVAQIGGGPVMRALGWHRLDFQTLGADPKEKGVQAAAPFARLSELAPILAETGYAGEPGAWRRGPAVSILRRALAPLIAAAAAIAAALLWTPLAWTGTALFGAAALLAPLQWRRHRHSFGEAALFVRGGVLSHRIAILRFERVQAIEVVSGPLQRRLGLASVRIDTAGAPAGGGLVISDLAAGDAAETAERVLRLLRTARARTKGER